MPRGVYDRTKTKEQRAAEKEPKAKKSAKAAPQKRKYTRRAVAQDVSPPKESGRGLATSSDGAYLMMSEVRQNITVLNQVRTAFGELPSVASEIDAQVVALGQLRDKIFGGAAEETVEVAAEEVDEEASVAVSNGVASAPLPPSVPLPPLPIPTH
jgi:hypothetical protein